jgi:putative FmdB family regulatory protein
MPVYEYECPTCGDFETLHTIDEKLEICPVCSSPVQKLVSRAAFKCDRLQSEANPRYDHWLNTEGARRMGLPDDHPDKLEPVAKNSDLAHGRPETIKPGEFDVKKCYDDWHKAGKPDIREKAKAK